MHLFERECSIQRRHQKVIEEAPSVLVTPKLRQEMGQVAINAAKAAIIRALVRLSLLLINRVDFILWK
ncbi:MAG: hypothetical protein IPP67_02975 [Rhodospirillaceae bacterium]|nr:hypothetical protein [Rhodospirillaceae bacterium]